MGFSLPRTGLGFRCFPLSSRTFQLLEFSNFQKILFGGRERKEKRICGMCEHVHICVLFMYKLLDLIALYVKRWLSRTQDTNQSALCSAK